MSSIHWAWLSATCWVSWHWTATLPSVASLPCSYEQTGTVSCRGPLGWLASQLHLCQQASQPLCLLLKEVAHYFCDLAPLMRLACVDWVVRSSPHCSDWYYQCLQSCAHLGLCGGILRAVLKLPSAASRAKAFSTCSSHITVVVLFFASAFIVYVGPPESRPEGTDKLIALVYTFLTPFLNPIIYTFRNKEVREAVRRVTQSIRAMMKRPWGSSHRPFILVRVGFSWLVNQLINLSNILHISIYMYWVLYQENWEICKGGEIWGLNPYLYNIGERSHKLKIIK